MRRVTPFLALVLALSLPMAASAVSVLPDSPAGLRGGVFETLVSLSANNLPLRDALRLLAQKGRLNLAIEDDLTTTVNIEFKDVRLGDALDTLLNMGGLQSYWRGAALAVVGRKKAFERGLLAGSARIFRLRYASAVRVADFLNSGTLTMPYQGQQSGNNGGQQGQKQFELAKADPRTNTVLVMGAPADISLAERAITALDQPLQRRVYKLSHANAVQVASLLNATIFNNGNKSGDTENVRVDVEGVTEGAGASSAASGVELTGSSTTVRSKALQSGSLQVEAKGSVAVPDSRANTVIVLGSPETLAQADELIPQLDQKLRQVAIDVEVVEMSSQDAKDVGGSLSGSQGQFTSSFDPNAATSPGWNLSYDPTAAPASVFRARLNALVSDRKAKILARPTIIASDNTESQINIVDEVVKGTRISNQQVTVGGQSVVVVEPIFGVAGITLNILPRIGADGNVTLRLHPTVSSVRETQKDSMGNQFSLLSRRELITQQVMVASGSTLALGGLTQTTRTTVHNKFPILGDIPLLGYLFSSSSEQEQQTELMLVVTPRILND